MNINRNKSALDASNFLNIITFVDDMNINILQ